MQFTNIKYADKDKKEKRGKIPREKTEQKIRHMREKDLYFASKEIIDNLYLLESQAKTILYVNK